MRATLRSLEREAAEAISEFCAWRNAADADADADAIQDAVANRAAPLEPQEEARAWIIEPGNPNGLHCRPVAAEE